jgi:hypothetical protein
MQLITKVLITKVLMGRLDQFQLHFSVVSPNGFLRTFSRFE